MKKAKKLLGECNDPTRKVYPGSGGLACSYDLNFSAKLRRDRDDDKPETPKQEVLSVADDMFDSLEDAIVAYGDMEYLLKKYHLRLHDHVRAKLDPIMKNLREYMKYVSSHSFMIRNEK